MNINNKDSYYRWIDISKGIGILFVEYSHIGGLPYIWWLISPVFVSLFFVISGYTYKNNVNTYKFITNKARKLLLPYLFYNILLLPLDLLFGQNIKYSIIGIIYSRYSIYTLDSNSNIILLSDNSPTWFLTALFVSFILFIFIIKSRYHYYILFLYIIIGTIFSKIKVLLP